MYNLCCEKDRQYDHGKFNDQVECFPLRTTRLPHWAHPQVLPQRGRLLEAERPERGGCALQGRQGEDRPDDLRYLLYSGRFNSAAKAMEFYGDKRTKDGKGVTIPSQKRFIRYYNTVLDRGSPRPGGPSSSSSTSALSPSAWRPLSPFTRGVTTRCLLTA